MKAQVKLGKIGGIPIGLHYSWFIIALLIVLSLAQHFRAVDAGWGRALTWIAAIITGVLFFTALLLHELAHSLVAKARGLRVRAITLFALGGVSQIESEASDAKTEFWIAIVGPITSLVIGVILLGAAQLTGWRLTSEPASPAAAVLVWLGYINIMLAAFNMIPGYPLDGGRVLRAVFWWITRSADRATKLASQVGQIVAFLFISFGLVRFFFSGNFGGLWLAFIGWFLLDASRSSYIQTELISELRDRRVADIMDRDYATVEGHLSLQDFLNEYILRTGRRCFVVTQNDRVSGLITTHELKEVNRSDWTQRSVQSAMRPLAQMRAVTPDTPAIKALEVMTREDLNQLPVISDGRLEGLFSRGRVLSFLRTQAELHQRAA
ncbi:MAG TPA: site-2 protease family protein [Terriglobales bacterium]|nr:site-2 protease family protein [Terriglobales bacterium]